MEPRDYARVMAPMPPHPMAARNGSEPPAVHMTVKELTDARGNLLSAIDRLNGSIPPSNPGSKDREPGLVGLLDEARELAVEVRNLTDYLNNHVVGLLGEARELAVEVRNLTDYLNNHVVPRLMG